MKREEEILKAARDYTSYAVFSKPSDVIHFEHGAKWAYIKDLLSKEGKK